MKTIRATTWIAVAVLVAAAFILVMHLSTNTMEFSHYNSGWNGTSLFFSDLDRHRYHRKYQIQKTWQDSPATPRS